MGSIHKRSLLALLGLIVFIVSGCGGQSGQTQVAEGGIGGTGITSSGSITAFGSVWVNGIKFETDDAIITLAGVPATVDDLRIGMNVSIKGTINDDLKSGYAREIFFEPTLMAAISDISAEKDQFTIGSTLVKIDDLTSLDELTTDDLANGVIITISGIKDNSGVVRADYIKLGAIDGVDLIETPKSTNIIHINSAYEWMTGEGFVSDVNSITEFKSEGWTVTHNETTAFTNGSAHEIVPGVHMTVVGEKIGDQHILAKQLTFIVDEHVSHTGPVTSVDLENNTITGGVLSGVTFYVTVNTIMRDDSVQAVTNFSINDISPGDNLNILLYVSGGTMVAGQVVRID